MFYCLVMLVFATAYFRIHLYACCTLAPYARSSMRATSRHLGKVTPKVTKVHIIFIVTRRECKFLIKFFICTCRTDLRRLGPHLLVLSTSGASVHSRRGYHPQGQQLLVTPPGTPSPPTKQLLLQQLLALGHVRTLFQKF